MCCFIIFVICYVLLFTLPFTSLSHCCLFFTHIFIISFSCFFPITSHQIQQPSIAPPQLRPIVNCMNVRFDEFTISESIGLVVGKSVFHQAMWQNTVPCTLILHQNSMVNGICSGGVTPALKSLTEFNDLVPNNYLPSMPTKSVQMMQGELSLLFLTCQSKVINFHQLYFVCVFNQSIGI